MASTDRKLQQKGAFFVTAIVWNDTKSENENRRIYKEDTKLVIDAGALPNLIKLLSSENTTTLVLDQSLDCLVKIAAHFPKKVVKVGALSPLKRLLKSRNEELCSKAAMGLFYISNECEENITAIITDPLIQLLESKTNKICEDALHMLNIIVSHDLETCQFLLDHNILEYLKKLFGLIKSIDLLIVRFIKKVASLGEDQVDMIICENFIPFIIKQFYAKRIDIKIETVKAIINIVQYKRAFVPNLVRQYDVITLLSNKFNSVSPRLLKNILTALNEIIYIFKDKEMSRRMIENSANLKKLLRHKNESIRDLSKTLYEFVVNDIRPDLSSKRNIVANDDHGTIESDSSEDDDSDANENVATPTSQKRRRPPNFPEEEPTPAIKRSKSIDISSDDEPSVSSHNDLDDVFSRPHSPVGTRNIPIPSTPTRLQSNVNEIVINETDR